MRERQNAIDLLTLTLMAVALGVMLFTPADIHAAIAQYGLPAMLIVVMGALVMSAGRKGGDS
jgi:hypothetical protein